MSSLHILYASTSGHTEYVAALIADEVKKRLPAIEVEMQRAEKAQPEDLLRGDVVVLACGTWNTGGAEGQLSPPMHELLRVRAKDADLKGARVFCVGLGDARYHFTARALTLLEEFVQTHNGHLLSPGLKIVNEPYGQEAAIADWATHLLASLSK